MCIFRAFLPAFAPDLPGLSAFLRAFYLIPDSGINVKHGFFFRPLLTNVPLLFPFLFAQNFSKRPLAADIFSPTVCFLLPFCARHPGGSGIVAAGVTCSLTCGVSAVLRPVRVSTSPRRLIHSADFFAALTSILRSAHLAPARNFSYF
jgi:hypothetical protein